MPIIVDASTDVSTRGISAGGRTTLAQIEQEVARRVGPYIETWADRQVPTTAATTYALFPELRSTVDQDLVSNLWALRRGVCWNAADDAFTDLDEIPLADRQRLVSEYDPNRGQIFVDRPWSMIPEAGELFEFHHLNPRLELRRAVLAGLRRCFLQDRGRVYPNVSGGQIDLTTTLPWLVEPNQCLRLQAGYGYASGDIPFEAVSQAGHVLITSSQGPMSPGGMWLTALRPAWSWVNGAESTTGPTDDWDTLDIDLDYAAAAGHIEAWHLFPSRMFAAAAGNLQATQEMAAREFTRQAMIWGPEAPRSIGFSETVRLAL